MPICNKCKKEFKNYVKINEISRNLCKRKYCLDCSPFGMHNTSKIIDGKEKYHCKCGEIKPENFYGHKKKICSKCHNEYTKGIGQEKRKKAILLMGGKCSICGYDKYYGCIDIHHIDPEQKDDKFKSLRGWSWNRILEEIKNCIPLCRNCHGEVHNGIKNIKI